MPVVRIQVQKDAFTENELEGVSKACHSALMDVIKAPEDDFFQLILELPKNRFLHTPSFLGMNYSDRFILLEITFLMGRSGDTRVRLLKVLNDNIVKAIGISPDDVMTLFYEIPPENCSFGQGVAQRVGIVPAP